MIRSEIESDRTQHWLLVMLLVALALVLALATSSGYGRMASPQSGPLAVGERQMPARPLLVVPTAEPRARSEAWFVARELYRAGRWNDSARWFGWAAAQYPDDPALEMWRGMAAYRAGDTTAAVTHWETVWADGSAAARGGVWPALALAATALDTGDYGRAAELVLPLEADGANAGIDLAGGLVDYYAALVYEAWAYEAPSYLDAAGEIGGGPFTPPLATTDPRMLVHPSSRSWLVFLTRRALERACRASPRIDGSAHLVAPDATAEPSLAPTVGELLEALGAADFPVQARQKLRAVRLYESARDKPEIFDDIETLLRGRFVA